MKKWCSYLVVMLTVSLRLLSERSTLGEITLMGSWASTILGEFRNLKCWNISINMQFLFSKFRHLLKVALSQMPQVGCTGGDRMAPSKSRIIPKKSTFLKKYVSTHIQSSFLDNPQKYTVVRIVPSWSKTVSLIGITITTHEGIFKSSQNQIKRKTF